MLYSDSGGTKTTQSYFLIKDIYKKTKKKFRVIMSDGGGIAPFADAGMIGTAVDVFDFSNRQHALADLRKLSLGYWPRWITKDNKLYSSYTDGTQEYFRKEDVCMTTPDEWKGIAGYLIEGMTSTGSSLMSHCANQDATNKIGFKGSFIYEEDGFVFGGVDKGHYNIIQKEVYDRHTKGFSTLPMEWLIWTALVGKGEDRERITVFGPQLAGSAKTAEIPSWFHHCLHINKERYVDVPTKLNTSANGQEKEGYVLWFQKHTNGQDGVPYLAKIRLLPELVPKLMEYCPYGFFPVTYTYGLDTFFKLLERIKTNK